MKRLAILLLLLGSSSSVWAQQRLQTAVTVGTTVDNQKVEVNGEQMVFGSIVGGSMISQNVVVNPPTANDEGAEVMSGFPFLVKYFPRVFDPNFFVSKGYFSNLVQLQWDAIADDIDQFRVYRKGLTEEGDSILVGVLGPDDFFFKDETIDFGKVYKYTVFARGLADDLRLEGYNYIESDGFAFPTGSVSGQVKFEGGTAVKDVSVTATTEGNLSGKSVEFTGNGQFLKVVHGPEDDELDLSEGFSIQMWFKDETDNQNVILFKKGTDYQLTKSGDGYVFTVGGSTLGLQAPEPPLLEGQEPVPTPFKHITATFNGSNLYMQIRIGEDNIVSGSEGYIGNLTEEFETIVFGGNGTSNGQLIGQLDEIRLWNRALSTEEINENYFRYISGSSEGLIGYWRFDMGVGKDFYDFSRRGSTFWENHGELIGGAKFSLDVPLQSQLSFRGLTDEEGNYTIEGFPYESAGSLYKFTALKTYHEFDPPQQTRFVGPSESIHNNIDFTDISSFPVSGMITYKNSPFPVEGVSILVDGKPAFDGDGELILTDNQGQFTVDVPIGEHSIRMSKANHTFEDEGRFPAPTEEVSSPLYNFQEPLNGLEFIDNTVVKVAGRVVGGPVEEAKLLGFGKSKNNIGNATIVMETQKGLDITNAQNTSTYTESNAGGELRSEVELNTRRVTINPDVETGEFVAYLPPEQYVVNSITAGDYVFDDSFNTVLDLREAFAEQFEVVNDTVSTSVNSVPIEGVIQLDETDYNAIETFTRNDTLFTVGIDTFRLQKRQDFVLRNRPSIDVVNANGQPFFGEPTYTYRDNELDIEEEIPLYDEENSRYTFNYPIFSQRNVYEFEIQLFEEYTNADKGNEIDRVPVVDGRVEVSNELSLSKDKVVLPLDDEGRTDYGFRAGIPNRSADVEFTKPMSITAYSGKNGAIQTVWRENDPFLGIVFGSQPFGNNFVTTGPNIVDYILRDPPGSNSSATIAKGETVSSSSTFSITDNSNETDNVNLSLGVDLTSFLGLGGGIITEVENDNSLDIGTSYTKSYTEERGEEQTLTLERTISTSDDPLFVGESADLFIGRSTNIVYGAAGFVELIPEGDCVDCAGEAVNGYRLGTKTGLNFGSEFNTAFVYSQFFIENTLVPNLKKIRNSLLTYAENPDAITPTEEPVYLSRIPASDPRFGSSNTDKEIWGAQVSNFTNEGESYIIKYPATYEGKKSDTIAFYNKQISSWEYWLGENEKQKYEAELDDNISFESGAIYEESVTTERTETSTLSSDFTMDTSVATEIGLTVNDAGFTTSTSVNISTSKSRSSSETEQRTTTSSFSLQDSDIGDSYTIDVKKPKDGFGTVFSTRGGQTVCPYEGETVSKYWEPGRVLSAATQRREGPVITAQEAVRSNVPDNRSANFTINLSTDSETGEPFPYTLFVDPESNPNGAQVSINGDPIGNGLSFLVKPGETITQTVSVRKGRDDVFAYEDMRLLLVSQCQFDPTEPQPDIADTARISAFFVPGCSEIQLTEPGDNWVLNTNAPEEDILQVNIGGYDLNLSDFTRFQFQYRAVGSDTWIPDMTFYNSNNITQAEFDAINSDRKQLVSDASVIYSFDMGDLPDQEYEIRSVAFCDVSESVVYQTPSDVLRGVKDTQRPQTFGAPQPADGILSANDEILIRFNEEIVGGRLTPSNFSVKGVLNNAPVRNSTSVNLDGEDNYVRIENGLRLGNSSFTIEFKLRRNTLNEEVVIFSKGNTTENQLEIGFNENNQFFVQYGDQRITSTTQIDNVVNFNHYSVSYDADNNEIFAYQDDNYLIEQVALNDIISGEGSISLGKSNITDDRFVDGRFLDLRIWNRFKSLDDVFASIRTKLNGIEVGLIGYWPFDEAYGTLAVDRARFRNATLFAEWSVLPLGYAYAFDGVDDYLAINTASTVVIGKENDFTIEMWMNGAAGQTNAVLFSSGRGTSGSQQQNSFEDPAKSLSLGFNQKGELYLASNGQNIILAEDTEDLLNDDWHHVALSVSRTGSAIIYIDGEQKRSFSSDVIGGFIRAKMTIGARSTKINLNAEDQDRFFNGKIDEFRIWNVARTADNILLDRNARLSGGEFGLIAYYPFDTYKEEQGIQQLDESIVDQDENPNGNNGGTATSNGGADFTSDTPNITLSRPVKDVPFSYVVNGDEMVITPNANSQAAIERSVLEISVRNVEDVNGNRLASPISFTAFVNRNLVKWTEESISIEKDPNEDYEFEVDIVNLGGNGENFNISNLPLWLSAEPQSGTIDPQSNTTITFKVNSGLNIGYYDEDIFLTTDFGFSEKLLLDVKVLEPEPDWDINPAEFQYSMSIVAQLDVDGIISRDENDIIAAYVDNELRGVARLEYVQEFDEYMAFMDIFSNVSKGEVPIEFRAFDANKGIEYRDLDPIEPIFESNSLIGRPSAPQVLQTGELRSESYDLSPGFSWVSFNLNSPQLDNSTRLFENIDASKDDRVTYLDLIDFYTGNNWIGNLSRTGGFRTDVYYLVSLANGGTIDLVGTKVDADTEINIEPGFNRISFVPDFNLSVNEAFASLSPVDGDIVRSQFAFAIYEDGLGWIGSLKNLEPGQGYLYFSNAEEQKSLVYPSSTFLSLEKAPDYKDEKFFNFANPWRIDLHEHPMNMAMVVDLDAPVPDNFVLAAFDARGNLLGTAEANWEQNEELFYFTIHGAEKESLVYFKAFDRMEGEYFNVNEITSYQPFTIQGDRAEPVLLTMEESFNPNAKSVASPNPFKEELVIELSYPSTELEYEILDNRGVQVGFAKLSSEKKIRTIRWDGHSSSGSEVAAGVYLIKIRQAGRVETIKVIKID